MIYDVDKYSGYWFMKIIWFNNIFWVSPMEMITGFISNGDIVDPTPVNSRTKKNRASDVDVGKYRSPHAPRVDITAALNNHKESLPIGGLENRFVTRKEINA